MKAWNLRMLAVAAIALAAGNAFAGDDDDGKHRHGNRTTTLAVYGDAPYGTKPGDNAEVLATPAFIDAVNADKDVSRIIHVGDIHSGKTYCTQDYDQTVFNLWLAYQKPLVYTPGDNEWTDCNKVGEGGNQNDPMTGLPIDYASGDPVANLDLIRSIFFPRTGWTLGQHPARVTSQAREFNWLHPSDRNYVENVMWEDTNVLFVTINLPGGSNDDVDPWYTLPITAAQIEEKAERDGADLRWLDKAFDEAAEDGVEAVVIALQADMWDLSSTVAHEQAYEPFVASIANHTTEFGKPVILFNGDSHVYLSDNPFDPSSATWVMHPFYNVPNFHRVVVHGSTFPLEYLKLTITPGDNNPNGANAFGPFSWTRVIP